MLEAPHPKPPELLLLSSEELRGSPQWAELVEQWLACPVVVGALDGAREWTLEGLSAALTSALHKLVELAGGWRTRPTERRPAFESAEVLR